jgi:hypothetical protein
VTVDVFADPSLRLAEEDIRIDLPTRQAQLRWAVVVQRDLPVGLLANAVACISATVGRAVPEIVGPGEVDAAGSTHQGLPWVGCSVLAASAEELAALRAAALVKQPLLVIDMVDLAQRNRVYSDYLRELSLSAPENLWYLGVSVLGPKNKVDKLVGKLPLLS